MRTAALLILLSSAPSLAQSAILIDIDNPTLLPGESTTVTLWAAWPDHEFAFASAKTSLETSVGSIGWSDVELVPPMDGPGTTQGELSPTGIDGIIAGQLNYCPATLYCPTQDNPIALWRATYTAPTDVAAAFDIDLLTRTTAFEVYFEQDVIETHSYLDELTEDSATIHVIPAPAGAFALGIGIALAGRRRG